MKKTLFIKNAAVLTCTGLLLRLLGIVFKIWLTRLIGQAGIGLYQIVFSFYVLVSTFATTGIPTAVTRICGDEAESGTGRGLRKTVGVGISVSVTLAAATMLVLFFGAGLISKRILFDLRASFSIRMMGFSLPFTGICACFRAYFIARRKATPPAVAQITEQLARIVLVFGGIKLIDTAKPDIVCGIVMLGDAAAEGASCALLAILYKLDIKKVRDAGNAVITGKKIIRRTGEIAVPIAAGGYLNSLLRTLENVLVPKKLVSSGDSELSALEKFGMIKGSALPILLFPSTLLNSISTLLLPELSVAGGKKRYFAIKSTVEEVVITTCAVSFYISALFFVCGRELGVLFYNNRSVGTIVRVLSPLIPVMYLDSICDGMLKGLNKQKYTFCTGISDSALRLVLIMLVVPEFGLAGFIGIMYFSNAYTGIMNIGKLIRVSKADISFSKYIFLPVCCAVSVVFAADTAVRALPANSVLVYIMLVAIISSPAYLFLVSKLTGIGISRVFK